MSVQLFNGMTTREKIEAVNSGLFPDMSDQDKDTLTENLKKQKSKEEVISLTRDILVGAGIFVDLAQKFGVDPKLVNDVAASVRIGNSTFEIITNAFSGDVLGVFSAIGRLFGIKDAGAERHKQVMKHLRSLLKGQKALLDNQEKIMEDQRKMMRGQVLIFERLDDLQRILITGLDQSNRMMQKILGEVIYNRKILMKIFSQGSLKCESIVTAM